MGANQSTTTTTTTTPPVLAGMGGMGGFTTTVVSTTSGNTTGNDLAFEAETQHISQNLQNYKAIHRNVPGSGRMMKTYTLQHQEKGSLAVVKTTWIQSKPTSASTKITTTAATVAVQPQTNMDSNGDNENDLNSVTAKTASSSSLPTSSSTTSTTPTTATSSSLIPSTKKTFDIIRDEIQELKRIKKAVGNHPHVAPFMYWRVVSDEDTTITGGGGLGGGTTTPIPPTPIYLLRSHVYTTLSDRLASRPFLHHVEKLWITYQLLETLDYMHSHQVVHGFLTTENVGLTSWNWVVLLDISSYKSVSNLPNDDPSDYLYYFQEQQSHNQRNDTMMGGGAGGSGGGGGGTSGEGSGRTSGGGESKEKRCYLAPERFRPRHSSSSSSSSSSTVSTTTRLEPSSDIFSLGCVLMETFLNGERSMDLGDLMEYRQARELTSTLQNKLNKIESSAIRAACRHMLHLNPTDRLQAYEYLERLCRSTPGPTTTTTTTTSEQSSPPQSQQQPSPPAMPSTFKDIFDPLFLSITRDAITPDGRMAICAASYSKVIQHTVGIHDMEGEDYFTRVLGMKEQHGKDSDKNKTNKKTQISESKNEEKKRDDNDDDENDDNDNKSANNAEFENLVAETEALLQKLETMNLDDCDMDTSIWPSFASSNESENHNTSEQEEQNADTKKQTEKKQAVTSTSPNSGVPTLSATTTPSSLLLFLQLILSTIRHVQRPSSKIVGLQLLERLGKYSSDEARLQRIVPTTIVLLQDQDPLVRADAIKVLTSTLTRIETFPPSDSKVFPQYILKRVTHLITDPSLVVRVAFSECIPRLAETSNRFLDISHAVRLYEAVGGGGGGGGGGSAASGNATSIAGGNAAISDDSLNDSASSVFGDDVTKLLDGNRKATPAAAGTTIAPPSESKGKVSDSSDLILQPPKERKNTMPASVSRTLINSTYDAELASLREIVSRWVIHITTDQSEQSSPPKIGLLRELARLCNFFGREGAISFILPQILTFLNDRRDWQLRAGLFEHLPALCYIIGRAATEHFVFPLLETALVDGEEQVMSHALYCLSSLVEMGLLSRAVLVGTPLHSLPSIPDDSKGRQFFKSGGMFEKYAPLLLYPSTDVRRGAIALTNAAARKFGFPDRDVFLVPLLRPYLRFEPSTHHLTTPEGLAQCLVPPWTRAMLREELEHLSSQQSFSPTAGKWTSIGIDVKDGLGSTADENQNSKRARDGGMTLDASSSANQQSTRLDLFSQEKNAMESHVDQVLGYLRMLARSQKRLLDYRADRFVSHRQLASAIEASLKLAQHIKFPNQKYVELIASPIPAWYTELREMSLNDRSCCSESTAIRSVASLSKVYGLSLMHATVDDPKAPIVDTPEIKELDMIRDDVQMTAHESKAMLVAEESKSIERACIGEWGPEASLDPLNVDTSLLVAKLKGLKVPPLPPQLGALRARADQSPAQQRSPALQRDTQSERPLEMEWRPKTDALVASSIPTSGHSAPVARLAVAKDQSFFVSGSHDGTCRVWELRQVENSNGILKSSLTYSGHSQSDGGAYPRINDVAIVENSNSVVSGASDGSVHVWRVGVVSTSKQAPESPSSAVLGYDRSRVSGSSAVRNIDSKEGEILAVSHFNSPSASVVAFATQKGCVHTWDLRCAREPFILKHRPDLGYLTSMALGNDRHWMITGTNRGFMSLWDIRFQKTVKLWQHSSAAPVNRLGAWFGSLPRGHTVSNNDTKPYMFAACGPNECSMFDIIDSSCRQCFRVLDPSTGYMDPSAMTLPSLEDIPIASSHTFGRQNQNKRYWSDEYVSTGGLTLKPRITGMVGSINGRDPRDYLITGGSDCVIRYFDFVSPNKCYTVSGGQQRPSFERVDFEGQGRLITCRDNPALRLREMESARHPHRLQQGICRPDTKHNDAITDIKMVKYPMRALISCSNDGAIKIFR